MLTGVLRKCALLFFVLVTAELHAEGSACEFEIKVNDKRSSIKLNGVDVQSANGEPAKVPCADFEQELTISSSDGQTFSRLLPPWQKVTPGDRHVNIFFLPKNSNNAHSDVSAVHLKNGQGELNSSSADLSERIVIELVNIREILAQILSGQKPLSPPQPSLKPLLNPIKEIPVQNIELSNAVPVDGASETKRRPSSLPHSAASIYKKLPGIYVQMLSVNRKSIPDLYSVKTKLEKTVAPAVQESLLLCANNIVAEQLWTRFILGPFQNETRAHRAIASIGNDAFILRNPQCDLLLNK